MYAKLFGFLLFACQIILNRSSVVDENINSASVTPTRPKSITLPGGYTIFPDDHAAYKVYSNTLKWSEAREHCTSEGARLAIADTPDKIVHINSLKKAWLEEWVHVGFYRSDTTDQWIRIDDNSTVTSLKWVNRFPKDTGRCVGISVAVNALVNYGCYSREWFACEIPI